MTGLDFNALGKFLADLGLTPLNILLVFAVVTLYRDNRELFGRLQDAEKALQQTIDKLNSKPQK